MIGFVIAMLVAVPATVMTAWAAWDRCWWGVRYFAAWAILFGAIAWLQWIGV